MIAWIHICTVADTKRFQLPAVKSQPPSKLATSHLPNWQLPNNNPYLDSTIGNPSLEWIHIQSHDKVHVAKPVKCESLANNIAKNSGAWWHRRIQDLDARRTTRRTALHCNNCRGSLISSRLPLL